MKYLSNLIILLREKLYTNLKTSHLYELLLKEAHLKSQINSLNKFNIYGNKCFSQNDEDGLTLEIIRRLKINDGVFAEFGVGNGIENNTLILLSLGWKGLWVGNESLEFNHNKSQRLIYSKGWITLDNITGYAMRGLDSLNSKEFDVISLDLDGNDYYFVEKLLKNSILPKLFIVEYNGKFIPPIKFKIEFNANHIWSGNEDYFGCSLSTYNELFSSYGYNLICCNSWSGINAFFVKKEYAHLFPETPKNISSIYIPPFYHKRKIGHPVSSIKTIEHVIK